MSAVTDEMVEAALPSYSEGECSGLDEQERREVVRDILEAGFALLPAQTEPDAGRVEVASLLEKAVAEYLLEHPSECDLQRLGRHAAIRGLMVRAGQYPALCERLNATPPSPPREEIEHQGVEASTVDPVDANWGKRG